MAKLTLRYESGNNEEEPEGSPVEITLEKDIVNCEDFFRQVLQLYASATFKNTVVVTVYGNNTISKQIGIDPSVSKDVFLLKP